MRAAINNSMGYLSNVNLNMPPVMIKWRARGKGAVLSLLIAAGLPLQAFAQMEWQTMSPAAAGFDAAKLAAVQDDLAHRGTTAFLIVRRGKIVCEWYAPGQGPERLQGTASLAKALVGGLSLLSAMNDDRANRMTSLPNTFQPGKPNPGKTVSRFVN